MHSWVSRILCFFVGGQFGGVWFAGLLVRLLVRLALLLVFGTMSLF